MQTMPAVSAPSKPHSQRIRAFPSIEDYEPVRAESPTTPVPPTRLSKRRSFRNRISVLDLQKLFSQGPSSSAPQPQPQPPRSSTDLAASTSTFSSTFSLVSAGSLSEDDLRRRSAERTPTGADDPFGGVLDMEMRLDSLHFDSLHFDPEEFDLQL